ncbi:hypothetical protein SAMN04488028_10299 [Reichenbachiella agariperforans]|uniref:Uncharacterized protein n=1 Tax=Reichenbachiella agariperforans TaxID=156994 RepID=A0A1M6N4Y3_REIAG|nr:hypothetical protein [Reichenbachiella agariperforans]SHJ90686.1 hypothetical protein SAMN04488028_10299 [Reichenbachiella agariperforans]
MYDIKADEKKNLLVLILEGFLTDQELIEGADLCISEAKKLRPGFVVINDISRMKPASPQGAQEIKRAQAFVLGIGVTKVIRVTDNPVVKMQFNRTGSAAGYEALEVSTMEEALALL